MLQCFNAIQILLNVGHRSCCIGYINLQNYILSLFRNDLPFEKGVVLHLNILEEEDENVKSLDEQTEGRTKDHQKS